MRGKRTRSRSPGRTFSRNSDSQHGRPDRGSGWWEEPTRHSLAARGIRTRGIRTPYDELQDRKFSPNYRSLATLMRDKRLRAMQDDMDIDHEASLRSRDSFINERIRDQRKLMEIYGRNNQVPGRTPMMQARGIWSSIKSGASRVSRGAKKVGGSIKRGAKKVGRGAKDVGGSIKRGAKTVGRKIAGPEGSRRRKIGGAVKRGAQAVGGLVKRGATALRSKFAPQTYTVDPRNYRRTNDLRGDNVVARMSIDEMAAEQQRLDQSNRALMSQWTVREKWNDRQRDSLENRRRTYGKERDYQRLQGEMFR